MCTPPTHNIHITYTYTHREAHAHTTHTHCVFIGGSNVYIYTSKLAVKLKGKVCLNSKGGLFHCPSLSFFLSPSPSPSPSPFPSPSPSLSPSSTAIPRLCSIWSQSGGGCTEKRVELRPAGTAHCLQTVH